MPVYLRLHFSEDKDNEPLYNNGLSTPHFPGTQAIIGSGKNFPRVSPDKYVKYEQEFFKESSKYIDDTPDFISWTGFKTWKRVTKIDKYKATWLIDPKRPNEKINYEEKLISEGQWSEPSPYSEGKTTWGWWVDEDSVDQWSSPLPPVDIPIGFKIDLDRPNTTYDPGTSESTGNLEVESDYSPDPLSSPEAKDPDVIAKAFGKTIEGDSSLYITNNKKTSVFKVGDQISSDLLSAIPGAKLEHNSKFKMQEGAKAVITSISLDKKRLQTSLPMGDNDEIISITYGEYIIGINYINSQELISTE